MSNLRANQADQALIQYEAGQELVAMTAMTTTDNKTFASSDSPWSAVAGYEPVIRPNGMVTGGVIIPTSGENDSVDVAAGTAYLAGVLESPTGVTFNASSTPVALARPGAGEFQIYSVTVDSDGDYVLVDGTATTAGSAFSSTRGADGGPPYIPTTSIEVGQIRLEGAAGSAVVTADIRQIPGISQERYDYPVYSEDYGNGEITLVSALPNIHNDNPGVDDDECKKVYVEVYTPTFASLEPASDFVPPEVTHSQTSTEVYGGTIGASSSSLNQGSFTAYLRDGVTDALIGLKNEKLWVKFFPHRLRAPYILAQGTLGISRTFPAGDSIQAACTLTADGEVLEFAE